MSVMGYRIDRGHQNNLHSSHFIETGTSDVSNMP